MSVEITPKGMAKYTGTNVLSRILFILKHSTHMLAYMSHIRGHNNGWSMSITHTFYAQ